MADFKHVGSYVSADLGWRQDTCHRVGSAAGAYQPISAKIFSAKGLSQKPKQLLASSLVGSRLLYNISLRPGLRPRDLARLEAVWSRVHRAIANQKFKKDGAARLSDKQIRDQLDVPSIECLALRARLKHFGSIVRNAPTALRALLQFRSPSGKMMAWTEQLLRDFKWIWARLPQLSRMPDPGEDFEEWKNLLVSFPQEWSEIVSKVHFTESSRDKDMHQPAVALNHACDQCGKAFPTAKALLQHCRVSHQARTPWHRKIATSICPCCKFDFKFRGRLLVQHLGDLRRNEACRRLVSDLPDIPYDQWLQVEAADRAARRQARHKGHSHLVVGLGGV